MSSYLLARGKEIYRERGLKTTAVMGIMRAFAPVVRTGLLHFFECSLEKGLPMVREVPGIILREGTFSDLHLLNGVEHTPKDLAISRLTHGDRWFMGIERETGKLTNYR